MIQALPEVFVTGLGLVTALADDLAGLRARLAAGDSAVLPLPALADLPSPLGARVNGPDLKPWLKRRKDKKLMSRPAMLALLGRCGCPEALEPLVQACEAPAHRQVCVALSALGHLGDDRGLGPLLEACRHPDPERRLRAVEALERRSSRQGDEEVADG